MIHNIVTDKNGDEHQAVRESARGSCGGCSFGAGITCKGFEIIGFGCAAENRKDNTNIIYKRRIKIGDIKR